MMTATKLDRPANIPALVERLISLGYHPVPIPAGSKGPTIAGWDKLRMTQQDVPRYFSDPGMLVGALHTNLACFDIDVYDKDLAAELVAEAMRRFPGALERIGQAPKSAVVLRLPEPGFKVHNTEKHTRITEDGEVVTAQVEVRTVSRQMVVYGRHPDTGRPYTWPRGELWDTHIGELPELTKDAAQSFRDWCNQRIRAWAGVTEDTGMLIDLGEYRSGHGIQTDERPSEQAFTEALKHVPANMSYEAGWLECLMGIHDFFGGSYRGLEVAKEWSSSDPRYNPHEVDAKWRSFKPGSGVSYKTVLHHAKSNGCDMSALWRMDHPPRVAQPSQEQTPAAPRDVTPEKPDEKPPTGGLEDWVFLSADNEFYNHFTGERMSVGAFNLSKAPITPSVEFDKPNGETVNKKFPPSKTLIEFLNGKTVSNTMYRPDLPDRFFWSDGIEYVNSYLPTTMPQADRNWAASEAWRICYHHIQNILNGDAEVIVKWMAHNVQFPGRKILWAPIIVGVQGDGKTTLSKILQAAMGRANVGPVSPEAMFSDFTGWAEGSCVRFLEEIRVHGNSRHNAMNKLKPLITNDSVEIVRKGKDGKQVANVTNYMALTNHMDALALDEGDRRWGVFKTRFQTRQDLLAEIGDDYWDRLHGAIAHNPGVIRGWLLNVDLKDFNRVIGPDTSTYKRMMIEAARGPAESDLVEALEIGGFGVGPDVAASDCLNAVIHANGGRQLNTSSIANIMREHGWAKHDQTVKWRGRNRRVYYRQTEEVSGLSGVSLSRVLRTKLDETDDGSHVEI